MIRIETHLRLNPGGAVEVSVGDVAGYKAGRVSADRVGPGALPVFRADFNELRKSMDELSTLLETFKAARGGGFIES
jgi:hypothetical protein